MNLEIERKFLVKGNQWRKHSKGTRFRQGYLSTDPYRIVRVRTDGVNGFINIKGISKNASRVEFEYKIPVDDAKWMLDTLCNRPLIEKTRYKITDKDIVWDVDEFWGENEGLVIAEVELNEFDQIITIPDWIGKEVTDDPSYYNVNLVENPYSKW